MMVPFRSAEDAWFWTMARLIARRDRAQPLDGPPRPCTPDDVVLVLDRLIKAGTLHRHHAIVLATWGELGMQPGGTGQEQHEWTQAIIALDAPLRIKGIVGESCPQPRGAGQRRRPAEPRGRGRQNRTVPLHDLPVDGPGPVPVGGGYRSAMHSLGARRGGRVEPGQDGAAGPAPPTAEAAGSGRCTCAGSGAPGAPRVGEAEKELGQVESRVSRPRERRDTHFKSTL